MPSQIAHVTTQVSRNRGIQNLGVGGLIAVNMITMMTALGMPKSVAVAA